MARWKDSRGWLVVRESDNVRDRRVARRVPQRGETGDLLRRLDESREPMSPTSSVVVCTMETENFSFMAAGQTEAEALAALGETLRAHRQSGYRGAFAEGIAQAMEDYGVHFHTLTIGAVGTRDSEPI